MSLVVLVLICFQILNFNFVMNNWSVVMIINIETLYENEIKLIIWKCKIFEKRFIDNSFIESAELVIASWMKINVWTEPITATIFSQNLKWYSRNYTHFVSHCHKRTSHTHFKNETRPNDRVVNCQFDNRQRMDKHIKSITFEKQ